MKLITSEMIEESTRNGSTMWDFLLEEAKEINSDDEPDGSVSQDEEQTDDEQAQEEPTDDEQDDNEPKLSEEELQQLIEQLQQSENMEADVKKLLDDGTINQADVEILGQALQSEPSPEDERQFQINNIQEMVIRFSIYDKLNALENKLDLFAENFPNVDTTFYKDVTQIREYIKVINSLIFNLEINLVYQIYANLEMKLISLFQEYKDQQ